MITRIRRPLWTAAHLSLLGLAAILVATTVSSVLRSRLRLEQGERLAETPTEDQPRARTPLSEYLRIAASGIFADVPEAEPAAPGARPARTSASLRLLGTGGEGEERYAVLEDLHAKRQIVLKLGETMDGTELVAVGWRRVRLRRGGAEEVLTVPADLGLHPATVAGRRAPGRPAAATAAADGAIRKIGEDRFLIARDEVDHQLANLSQVFTQMRAVPNLRDGRTDGFRIFAIRRGSIFQRIGLRNNDVVRRINGVELNDPARAMGLLQELQGATRLEVDVLRGGEPRTLSYEIR